MKSLEQQFLDNKQAQALHLEVEFRTFVQGALPVTDYCCKIKGMADAIGDLGGAISGRTLVLSVLRRLNGRFSHVATILPMQWPFPSFVETWSILLLE